MIHYENSKHQELTITWKMWLIITATALGIYLGGVVSGYFYYRAQQLPINQQRDARLSRLERAVTMLPEKTADKTVEKVKNDEGIPK